ncbi:MAG: nucleoside phosphorylase [Thermodesulfobacteriota bacterium]
MPTPVIEPVRQPGEPVITGPTLFWVNPGESGAILAAARTRYGRRHHLFHCNLLEIPDKEGSLFWAGPALGAPAAVLVLEKLIALGARTIVVYGLCGSLHPDLRVGDVLLPTWALSEEGTSAHYPGPSPPCSNRDLRGKLASLLADDGHDLCQGPIWTTDAPYRETKEKVDSCAGQGIMAVDMEYSALCRVAFFRNVDLAAVMLVSDELWRQQWTPAFHRKSFHKLSRRLFLGLADGLRRLAPPTAGKDDS